MKSILVEPGKSAILTNITSRELQEKLGFISFAYPFDDPVAIAHDDNGIANGRLPNRTLNGEIMPGPFYILSVSPDGDLCSLPPDLCAKYLALFSVPESFPPGKWKISSYVEETKHTAVFHIRSEWVPHDSGEVENSESEVDA